MKPDQNTAPYRVLIILMGSLGDVVRGLSLLPPLKRWNREVHVSWLVEPACQPLVAQHPLVDQLFEFDRSRGLAAVLQLRRELRHHSFDCVLDLQRHFKSGFFSWLSGSKRRVGFHRRNAKEGNWLFNTEYIDAAENELPKIDHYHLFLKHLGVASPVPYTFELHGESPIKIPRPSIGLVLGSSWHSKDWPIEGYAQLVSQLLEDGSFEVLYLLGTADQHKNAEHLIAQSKSNRVVSLVGKTSLAELTGVLSDLNLVVGPDSGPGHLAAAVGTPYISLFGPTSPRRVAPYGLESLVLRSAVGCSPCNRRQCPGLDKVCMRLISPEMVMGKIRELRGSSDS